MGQHRIESKCDIYEYNWLVHKGALARVCTCLAYIFIASSDQKNSFAAGSRRSINLRKCTSEVNLSILLLNLLSNRLLAKLKTHNRAGIVHKL